MPGTKKPIADTSFFDAEKVLKAVVGEENTGSVQTFSVIFKKYGPTALFSITTGETPNNVLEEIVRENLGKPLLVSAMSDDRAPLNEMLIDDDKLQFYDKLYPHYPTASFRYCIGSKPAIVFINKTISVYVLYRDVDSYLHAVLNTLMKDASVSGYKKMILPFPERILDPKRLPLFRYGYKYYVSHLNVLVNKILCADISIQWRHESCPEDLMAF